MPRGSGATSRSLSAYARQFLELMQKPDVDHIEGLSPGHLDRAEDDQPQPALDRRHRHRDLRLHAPALGARRRALFARHRPADRRADRQPDGRPRDGAARGHAAATCSPRSCAAARASIARSWPSGRRPASPASASTASSTRSRRPPRSTRSTSTTSRWWSTASSCATGIETRLADSFETALKLAEGLAYVDLVDGVVPGREGEAQATRGAMKGAGIPAQPHRLLREIRLPGLAASPSPRSSRGCSRSTPRRAPARPATASARSCCSTRTSSSPTTTLSHQEGRGRALGQVQPAQPLLHAGARPASRANYGFSLDTPWNDLPEEVRDVILHGTERQAGHAAPSSTAARATTSRSRSRA